MIKNIFFLLFSLFIFQTIAAQQTDDSLIDVSYDSLKSLYKQYRFSDLEKAKKVTIAYYKKAVLEKNDHETSRGSFLNAIVYDALGQQDSAHYFIDIYISRSTDANSYVNGIYKKGVIYHNAKAYKEAIEYYSKAYDLLKNTDEKVKLAKISNSVAILKSDLGYRKQALEYFKENLTFYETSSESNPYKLSYFNTLLGLSDTYAKLSEDFPALRNVYLDSAEIANTRGLKESLEANDLEVYNLFLTLKGIIHQKRGNLIDALTHLDSAEQYAKKLSFHKQLPVLYLYKGKNFFLKEHYKNAVTYLLKADSTYQKEAKISPFFEETYILLAKSYDALNDQKNAVKYYRRFEEKDKENDQRVREASENVYTQYDIPSFKNKINQLENQSNKQEQLSQTLIYISLGLLALLALGFVFYRNKVQKYKKSFNAILATLNTTEKTAPEEDSSQSYTIKDENIAKILQGLAKFEEKKLFLHKNCTINFVAKKIHTNKTYLSRTLQSHKQKKFVQYITDLRIDYALSQLKNDATFRKYDIKSIAAELGFNTSESFSKAFKKRTGIYPSFYIKNLNKLKE
ncbi:helix-turn-helix transcriptional regulator [Kordia sp. YSTF-M3]|uniref:Helix-turn-helix transcriptional regulator n=1 Tax=Kordia aestuariivivens TaxID=2759037 RepID=A0ABR7Q3V7_9FLAO|nr:response regulator transcription factor [Kordia aestuariivivens]MBC8753237.1 helix-turn-helix transcriptional regulator [Kordia aestuariivivens]